MKVVRRFLTFAVVALATAAGLSWWLHDDDVAAPVTAHDAGKTAWNADGLARDAGVPTRAPAPVRPAE